MKPDRKLGVATLKIHARELITQERYVESISYLGAILEKEDTDPLTWYMLAYSRMRLNELDASNLALGAALNKDQIQDPDWYQKMENYQGGLRAFIEKSRKNLK